MDQGAPSEKHILVIRMSAMGDVAMTVPVLLAVLKRYPDIRITVLTKAFMAPIFSGLPRTQVVVAQVKDKHKGVAGLYRLFKELQRAKINAVADLHNVLRSNILIRFFKFSGVRVRQIDKGRVAKKALTRAKSKIFSPLKTTHERYADVFAQLGYPVQLSKADVLTKSDLNAQLAQRIGNAPKKWVGVAPFAAFSGKMYPLALMKEIVSDLTQYKGYKVMLFGGGKSEVAQLTKMAKVHEDCICMAGQLDFASELDLISNLDLMLAMDSGNAHLAALYGVPTLTLWGVTHPYAGFAPFGQPADNCITADREQYPLIPTSVYGNKFPEGYESVMETISPKRVVDRIQELLG
ncbi:glycosyltransferase family 9 protein [Sediminicola luteus]|nr:glycosyltransferase family 9 protein [Sediminicola luteus]